MAMVSCDALTNVACLDVPFQVTVEPLKKFDPLIVNVNPFEPAAALDGENDCTVGTGFPVGGGVELPPPQEQNIRAKKEHTRVYEKGRLGRTRILRG